MDTVGWPTISRQLHDCCAESDLVTCLGSSTSGWAVWANGIAKCHSSPSNKRTTRTATHTQRCNEKSCTCSFLSLQSMFSCSLAFVLAVSHGSLYHHISISHRTNGNSERRGYLSKIMADVWPSWVFQAQSSPLQKCLLLHTPAIPLIGISGSRSWPWGMDRLAHGNMIKGFGKEMHGEEVERLNRRRIWKALNIVIKNLCFIKYIIRNNDF